MFALMGGLYGQERVGSIEGTASDASGASVAGATVELEGAAYKQSVTTNAAGAFLFASVPPGAYTLTIRKAGFSTYKASNLNLFNNNSVTNIFDTLTHANDGHTNFDDTADIFKGYDINKLMSTQGIRRDPRFGVASDYQSPRQIRLGFHFFF
jgi:hypothetical protein